MTTDSGSPPEASISNLYSILSDKECVKILHMLSEYRQPKLGDLGTRKRFYERMAKLKKAHLITKKKTKDGTRFELTDFGSKIHESILILRRAANLRWNLNAIDALDEGVPLEERKKLIEALIPEDTIRKILLEGS